MTQNSAATVRSILERVFETIEAELERHFWLWSTAFTALFLVCAIATDVRKPMWIDELFTLYMSQQAGAGEIVKATLEGCDGAPPLYAMMVHAIAPAIGSAALAIRLPSTLGFCGMILCLLAFCRRRLPAAYAMAVPLLVCAACLDYASEGRGYGIVLGCAAGALLCWQAAVEGRRRNLALGMLAFCAALMTAMHYYAVFFMVPLGLAELMRWRKSGKLDWGVAAAMTAAPAVLALHYPLIAASAPFQKHFWSVAEWRRIPEFYSFHVVRLLKLCIAPLAVLFLFRRTPDDGRKTAAGLTEPEWAVAGALSLMPVFVVVLSEYTTHVFVARYLLWAVPGIAILAAAMLCLAARGRAAAGVTLLGIALAVNAVDEARNLRSAPALKAGEELRQALVRLPDGPEPILVPEGHAYMELAYYAGDRIRKRLVYPLSASFEMRYHGYDTDSLLLAALRNRKKDLRIVDYDAAIGAQKRFILAALPENPLPRDLAAMGYRVVPIGSSAPPLLYEVTRN